MQLDIHKTLYPCYTTKKMPHVTATVTKIALRWKQCLFWHSIKLRCLPLSVFTVRDAGAAIRQWRQWKLIKDKIIVTDMLVSLQQRCWPQNNNKNCSKPFWTFGCVNNCIIAFRVDLDNSWNYLWYWYGKAPPSQLPPFWKIRGHLSAIRRSWSLSRCITCKICLRSIVTCGKTPSTVIWTYDESLPCHCYALKANSRTMRSQVSRHESAAKRVGLIELQAHTARTRTANLAHVWCEFYTSK